jgi:hypothetical protein
MVLAAAVILLGQDGAGVHSSLSAGDDHKPGQTGGDG